MCGKAITELFKKLESVPCGDKFPTCRFIKDSHKNKAHIDNQKQVTAELLEQVATATAALGVILSENLDEKLAKYDKILQQLSDLTGIQLKMLQVNRRTSQTYQLPSSIKLLESHLHHEYEIVGDFL